MHVVRLSRLAMFLSKTQMVQTILNYFPVNLFLLYIFLRKTEYIQTEIHQG
jgi:hypothetical protein